jgi:transcriptional regulator with XRE-family HTH domain
MGKLHETASFGERLRQARRDAGYSQEQLGERLHLSDRAVRSWETGEKGPRLKRLRQIAEVLGKPLQWFFGVEGGLAHADQDNHEDPLGRREVAPREGEAACRDEDAPQADGYSSRPSGGERGASHAGTPPHLEVVLSATYPGLQVAGEGDAVRVLLADLRVFEELPAAAEQVQGSDSKLVSRQPRHWTAGADLFGVRVRDKAMEPVVCEGDIVVVRPQSHADTGTLVVATLAGGQSVVRRLVRRGRRHARLECTNPLFETIVLGRGAAIRGVVVALVRDL